MGKSGWSNHFTLPKSLWFGAGGLDQTVESMPSNWEIMSSNPIARQYRIMILFHFVHLTKHASEHHAFISTSNFVWHFSSFLSIILQTLSYLFILFLPMTSIWKWKKLGEMRHSFYIQYFQFSHQCQWMNSINSHYRCAIVSPFPFSFPSVIW
jgi:hypothetical protein